MHIYSGHVRKGKVLFGVYKKCCFDLTFLSTVNTPLVGDIGGRVWLDQMIVEVSSNLNDSVIL